MQRIEGRAENKRKQKEMGSNYKKPQLIFGNDMIRWTEIQLYEKLTPQWLRACTATQSINMQISCLMVRILMSVVKSNQPLTLQGILNISHLSIKGHFPRSKMLEHQSPFMDHLP